MIKVIFRPEAESEVLEAQIWYEQCAPGLGLEFARAVDAAIASLMRNPFAYTQIEGEFRRIILRRFPYSIIYYLPDPAELVIVSCFHHRREPGSWH
ncbi:MAG: type II toxin-antitoxin system RelE/ParE family toxin, partial [Chitinophagaceae bacterium]